MKRLSIMLLSLIVWSLTSCNNYGKKVRIDDTMEVYVKGDSVTEDQAKKLGDYLAKLWQESRNKKSLQLSKDSCLYTVKMVVDESKFKKDTTADIGFMALKVLLQDEVFNNRPIKFVLTDNTFRDVKSY